jgi:hypothetical protein
MDILDIFRLKPNGRVLWIGSAPSLQTACGIIKLLTVDPSAEFLILNDHTNETTIVRAVGMPLMPWKS